ncbi:hypothetical protein [Streptomyces sp. NPDC101132]|uniref:hypothetical protein n=1 Tax=Streptomyces sp. NPDC101132 TaxID=3366110 RepID=UPI00382A6F08
MSRNTSRNYAGPVCPAGTDVIGGGFYQTGTPSDANLLTSHPNTEANRWDVWLKNPPVAADTGVRVYTICQPTG